MIYDVHGVRGEPFPKDGGQMVDALGRFLFPMIWCDTETGECERYVRDPKTGQWEMADETNRVKTHTGKYPAPLKRVSVPPSGFRPDASEIAPYL